MENCIFCKIVRGEIPCHKIYENEHVLAFLDINPITKGHTLTIPKKHATDLLEMNEHDSCEVIMAAKKIAPALLKAVKASGINLLNSNGKEAGQVVFHYHLHLIPRQSDDGVRLFTPTRKHAWDLTEVSESIRKQL